MKRRTLDLVFSIGGLLVAVLLLVLGLVLQSQANFAHNYVKTQLSEEKITFRPAANLSGVQAKIGCLIQNAGKPLTSGKQAQCYANEQIGIDVVSINGGQTFSQTSSAAIALKTQATAAQQSGAANAAALESQYEATEAKASTLFEGQTERGLLLTTYGFSILGDRAQQAAWVCYLIALVLMLAAIAGLVHAFTPAAEAQLLAISKS